MDEKKFADGDVIYIIIDDVDLNKCKEIFHDCCFSVIFNEIENCIEEVNINDCKIQDNGYVENEGISYYPYATKKEAFDALIKNTLKRLDEAKERVIEYRNGVKM